MAVTCAWRSSPAAVGLSAGAVPRPVGTRPAALAAPAPWRRCLPRTDRRAVLAPPPSATSLKNPFSFLFTKSADEGEPARQEPPPPEPATGLYVKLQPQAINSEGELAYPLALVHALQAVKSVGVEGVLVPVAWGLAEGAAPGAYDFGVYKRLAAMLEDCGLKMQVSLKFCAVGGVGLPAWVVAEAESNPDLLFQDQYGNALWDCLTIGADDEQVLLGRTAAEAYRDFMAAFRDEFAGQLGSLITEVIVGMGPHGELRYPSYPQVNGMWHFPGVGEFQCYDAFLRDRLRGAAEAAGQPGWGESGPRSAGHYCNLPHETEFFAEEHGGWDTEQGAFFLQWYSSELLQHGDTMLSLARGVFGEGPAAPKLGFKLPVVHWWYRTKAHAAELTAGVYRTESVNGYRDLAELAAKHRAFLQVSCAEMSDSEQSDLAMSSPQGLISDIREAAAEKGVRLAVENCSTRFDESALQQMERNVLHSLEPPAQSMCFVAMDDDMFKAYHWGPFSSFIKSLSAAIAEQQPAQTPEPPADTSAEEADAAASSGQGSPFPWPLKKFF
mmetsp:Transcript_7003/g.18100  ORF Transcript_7003/g.18100 Transcript_7003/m.18100 type:complete len:554 (+) Transcript_7003:192-1853(+)